MSNQVKYLGLKRDLPFAICSNRLALPAESFLSKIDRRRTTVSQNDNPGGEIIVKLDPLIKDIVADFLQHRKENASAILNAIENSDIINKIKNE